MRALRFENSTLTLSDIAVPSRDDEALVRVIKSGICSTDIEIVAGYAGFEGTIGHEFVGVVEESDDVPDLIGKRVVGEINVGCNVCDWCVKFDVRHCPNRTVLGIIDRDGCHAEYLTLPAHNLLEVPGEITDSEAIFAEPLAAAHGITEQVDILPETKVAVIGDGKLGVLCAWSLGLKSERLFLIGKHLNKLAVAEKGNVEGMLLEKAQKLKRELREAMFTTITTENFEIKLHVNRESGSFEHLTRGEDVGGELAFKNNFNGDDELVDYDGVYMLPVEVIETLEAEGFNIPNSVLAD